MRNMLLVLCFEKGKEKETIKFIDMPFWTFVSPPLTEVGLKNRLEYEHFNTCTVLQGTTWKHLNYEDLAVRYNDCSHFSIAFMYWMCKFITLWETCKNYFMEFFSSFNGCWSISFFTKSVYKTYLTFLRNKVTN